MARSKADFQKGTQKMTEPEPAAKRDEEWSKIEYQEAAGAFRNIDARIWNIYGLYLGGCGAASAYALTRADELTHLAIICVAIAVIAASFAQMAMVGHLQWGSDQFARRLRRIEKENGLKSHTRFREEHRGDLWGPHEWWHELRARDVMQWIAFAIIAIWVYLPFHLSGKKCSEIAQGVVLASMVGLPIVLAIVMTLGSRYRGRERKKPEEEA